jgi:hypothetical protein
VLAAGCPLLGAKNGKDVGMRSNIVAIAVVGKNLLPKFKMFLDINVSQD